MQITLEIPDETIAAIQYCVDNLILPAGITETVDEIILRNTINILKGYIEIANRNKNEEILKTVREDADLQLAVETKIEQSRTRITGSIEEVKVR